MELANIVKSIDINKKEAAAKLTVEELEQAARQAMLEHLASKEQALQTERTTAQVAATLPLRYQQADIGTLSTEIQQYAAGVILHHSDQVLLLGGPTGTGKTYAAAAIARQCLLRGMSLCWGTYKKHLRQIAAEFSGAAEHIVRMQNCDLLIIDDLGKERLTDYTQETLYDILNDRYSCLRPYVITTNLDNEELEQHLGDALYSRMTETATAVRMTKKWR